MKKLWHSFIVRVFPGTLEEYYAAREIHLRERKKYGRTAQYLIGFALFSLPLFLLSRFLPIGSWLLVVFPVTFGQVLLSDATTEHLCLLLLRRERGQTAPPERPNDVTEGMARSRVKGEMGK
jgi:hypothetical protein